MKTKIVLLSAALLAACTSVNVQPPKEQEPPPEPTYQISDNATVEQIRQLQPQRTAQLKIAVMPSGRPEGLSQAEIEAIERWRQKLSGTGLVDSLHIVPSALVPECTSENEPDCFFRKSRAVGARIGADALLFLSDHTTTDAYASPLSLLNFTVVGMWLVPAHHRSSYTTYEASLFDIDTGFLYSVVYGTGRSSAVRPFVYVMGGSENRERAARVDALDDLGGKLLASAELLVWAPESTPRSH